MNNIIIVELYIPNNFINNILFILLFLIEIKLNKYKRLVILLKLLKRFAEILMIFLIVFLILAISKDYNNRLNQLRFYLFYFNLTWCLIYFILLILNNEDNSQLLIFVTLLILM